MSKKSVEREILFYISGAKRAAFKKTEKSVAHSRIVMLVTSSAKLPGIDDDQMPVYTSHRSRSLDHGGPVSELHVHCLQRQTTENQEMTTHCQ
jgi:hypothetical protein